MKQSETPDAETLLQQVKDHCQAEPEPQDREEWESRLLELAKEIRRLAMEDAARIALMHGDTHAAPARAAEARLRLATYLVASSRQSRAQAEGTEPCTHTISPSDSASE